MANKDHAQGYEDGLNGGPDRSGDTENADEYRAGWNAAKEDTK